MSKVKLILSTAALLAAAIPAMADSRVAVDPAEDGGETSYAELTVDTKITFGPTGLTVVNGESSTVFAYSTLSKVRFETGVNSGVGNVMQNHTSLSLRQNPVETTLEVLGYDGAPTAFAVYSVTGAQALSLSAWQGEPVDVSHLTPGLYLLTVNNETLKFLKK